MTKIIKKYKQEVINFIKNNIIILIVFLDLLVLGDSLANPKSYDLITFSILILYGILAFIAKVKSKYTFIFCLILLLIMYFLFLLSGPAIKTEKTAVWLVLFMLIGIIQQWRE